MKLTRQKRKKEERKDDMNEVIQELKKREFLEEDWISLVKRVFKAEREGKEVSGWMN